MSTDHVAAFNTPDHVAIVIHNYCWRLGLAEGEANYGNLEKRLSQGPVITVPTVTLEGDANGAPHPDPASYANKAFPQCHKAVKRTGHGYTYLDPAFYHADFAADLPESQAEFEAHEQTLTAAAVFTTPGTEPAWKTKPSWYAVATSDRIINPDLERAPSAPIATQSKSKARAIRSTSHTRRVAALIEEAAMHVTGSE